MLISQLQIQAYTRRRVSRVCAAFPKVCKFPSFGATAATASVVQIHSISRRCRKKRQYDARRKAKRIASSTSSGWFIGYVAAWTSSLVRSTKEHHICTWNTAKHKIAQFPALEAHLGASFHKLRAETSAQIDTVSSRIKAWIFTTTRNSLQPNSHHGQARCRGGSILQHQLRSDGFRVKKMPKEAPI